MISSTANTASANKAEFHDEGAFNKFTRIFGPILSFLILLVGVVLFWVGIGYYYGYWGMFFSGVPNALANGGFSQALLYRESVGGVYIFSAILATLALVFTLLPIVLSKRMDNAGFVAGNAAYTCIMLGVVTFIMCSLIVASAYYAVYNHTVSLAGGCPNIIGLSPAGGDNYCYHFLLAYRLLIAGHVLSLLAISWAALVACQQLGKHRPAASTTYIERRTDISVA